MSSPLIKYSDFESLYTFTLAEAVSGTHKSANANIIQIIFFISTPTLNILVDYNTTIKIKQGHG